MKDSDNRIKPLREHVEESFTLKETRWKHGSKFTYTKVATTSCLFFFLTKSASIIQIAFKLDVSKGTVSSFSGWTVCFCARGEEVDVSWEEIFNRLCKRPGEITVTAPSFFFFFFQELLINSSTDGCITVCNNNVETEILQLKPSRDLLSQQQQQEKVLWHSTIRREIGVAPMICQRDRGH